MSSFYSLRFTIRPPIKYRTKKVFNQFPLEIALAYLLGIKEQKITVSVETGPFHNLNVELTTTTLFSLGANWSYICS
ncbi:MAG: hypothetical protein KUG76_03985 [Gammaproteobacteria bacterium]|nr:hypothetical protein [Gammaproteobacteria bacterium]